MRPLLPLALAAASIGIAVPAGAATSIDPTGDYVPGYIGPLNPDLDVTSFSVNFNPVTSAFTLGATFAGPINLAGPGFYVVGVNNGSAGPSPFAAIGQPNVRFNQAIVLNKDLTTNLAGVTVSYSGNNFTALVPLSSLNTATATLPPGEFGFNLWPRVAPATGQPNSAALISDFAPENATLAAVPEPSTWAMLILGFGLTGAALRYRSTRRALG
jgi:hypothetical protein